MQAVPVQIIGAERVEPLADRDDRPLAAVLEQGHRPSRRVGPPGHVHPDAALRKLIGGCPALPSSPRAVKKSTSAPSSASTPAATPPPPAARVKAPSAWITSPGRGSRV